MDDKTELQDLINRSREISRRNFGGNINFYYTSSYFPAISVTGSHCALNCKHCGRIMIERLTPATTPEELIKTCLRLHEQGSTGVLITGGCTREGKVPLNRFLDAIQEVKDKTDLILIAHTGIMDYGEAKSLNEAGIDGVCVDIVGSEETTREIYGIELYPEDYQKTLKAFERAGIKNISPHVCVGLHYGELMHEINALNIISCIKPSNVVIIGLTNLMGTPMEDVRIKPGDLIRILCLARIMFPESYVSLGCARGKGEVRSEIDKLAVQAGVNNIAVPTPEAYREAERLNLTIREFKACCALLPEQLR
ncbi:MAG: radical SAM protein [Candidatus Altiarchaeota archaeon]|nr:radical SAM protein [Candidatus Altiarchaeota archaeon]